MHGAWGAFWLACGVLNVLLATHVLPTPSAGCASYVATAMMLAAAGGRVVLPLGTYRRAANVPGRKPMLPIELE
jgi:hypothetical protein